MRKRWTRLLVVIGIAALAWAAAFMLTRGAGKADDFFYDAFYRLRPPQDMRNAEVVLVAVDDAGLAASGKPWPWPRSMWGDICTYLDHAGAVAIAFDIVFPNPSYYADDQAFADAMNRIKTPVVFGAGVKDGSFESFAPPIKDPFFGAVNLGTDIVYRAYPPELEGCPSLAEAACLKAAGDAPDRLSALQQAIGEHPENPFLLHYYGPHRRSDGTTTFRYVNAYALVYAQQHGGIGGEGEKQVQLSPEFFRGKIVVICAIARAAFDLKSSPYSAEYPGPEIQATAMENLLRQQQVHSVPAIFGIIGSLLAALLVAAGVVYPRWAAVKILVPVLVLAATLLVCLQLFRGSAIHWLSPVLPLAAALAATPVAFGYTYFAEDRQRRFMLKALSKVVSPAVAEQLAANPERLALGTARTELTLLFTDVAGFTDLAEGMDVQELGKFINRYLGEMSAQVFKADGTLDKYIGDAVMAFWNAPLPQKDHAIRACRAALHMIAREKELQAEFAGMGAKTVFTRVGINTASAAVGFIGSEHLFNYTAMGDGVNLASRLEGANKLYGTQILISESSAALVRDQFHLRQVDVLRVKGKTQPMAVFEVLGERANDSPPPGSISAYEVAFVAYQARKWDRAEQLLLEVLRQFGEDGPSQALLARVRDYRQNPPPDEWDGVYVSKTK